ncbi:MAG TPA: hypothetical protein PKE31_20620 [Pseudomonadota bacterium]|jgi:hypothetical protein|nr:hypothetical protein [Pseudomonadota bacterium]
MKNGKPKTFRTYKTEAQAHLWVTLSTGEYYPDILPSACELYKPVLVMFGGLLQRAHSSTKLLELISEIREPAMRIQVARVFRRYVCPEIPVEMLKKKSAASAICARFGDKFRNITTVHARFAERPLPDEALCALLWEYRERGKKGYDLTEQLFAILRKHFPQLVLQGPERAGRDILLGSVFEHYPKSDRPVDFLICQNNRVLAVGLARYDSDRGGAQEDDRLGQYREFAQEFLAYTRSKGMETKLIFINDGPGLLLGSMWKDYADLEDLSADRIRVLTLRMISERLSLNWLCSEKAPVATKD